MVRRAELKILITEQFESVNYLLQSLCKDDLNTESPSQIVAYKPTQRRQDNLVTEGNFGRTKSFVHQIFGDNNFEPNKSFRRQKQRQINTPFISQKSKWNDQFVRDKPAQPEKDF